MQRRIPDFPDSFHSWNFLSSIGSGITFLSFAIFFLYLFMRSFLIIILLFLNGIGFQSIIGATTVCYFLNLWNYKRRWMLRPLGRNCRRTLLTQLMDRFKGRIRILQENDSNLGNRLSECHWTSPSIVKPQSNACILEDYVSVFHWVR